MNAFEKTEKNRKRLFVLCMIGTFFTGLAYTWSVLQSPFITQLGGDSVKSAVVLCYTITVLSSTMSPAIFGTLIKKLGPGRTVLVGSIFFGLGYAASGFVHSMLLFYLVFGLGTGIGCGFIYPTLIGYTASLFPEKTGTVSGIIAGIYGGASILWSPLIARLIETKSLRFALLVIGAAALAVIFFLGLRIRPVPEEYILYKRSQAGAAGASSEAGPAVRDLTRNEMIKTRTFYAAILTFAFGCTSGMMVISQISTIMQESFSMTAARAALFASLISLSSMAGRFLWGTVSDHLNKFLTLSIICFLPVITMGALYALSGREKLMASVLCLAVTALCYGGFGGTITPVTARLFGSRYISENYGIMFLAFGFAGLAGPQLAVRLNSNGDYSRAFLAAAVISVISFVLSFVVRKMARQTQG